jgi:hypothetical protein
MSKPITPFSISAPGFFGLNLQDSPVDLSANYSLIATNCIIDKSGRIGSRKGWAASNSSSVSLGTNPITCIGELVGNDGVSTILATGGGYIFKLSGGVLTALTYGGGGVAPTISANNWHFSQLNGIAIFCQVGYDTLIYDPTVSTTQFRRLSEKTGHVGTFYQCNTGLSAYGRFWYADNGTDKNTIVWSDLQSPHVMTGGSSGSLNLLGIWPKGGDQIVTIAAHNNFLVIFGRKQILVYSGADDPANMSLTDHISGIGCIARDSVQATDKDVIFLSDSGVMSLMRTIQEKSAPMMDLSKNIRDELQAHINLSSMDDVKSVYSAIYGFYLLTMPTSSETYCFDTVRPLQDGSYRTTVWSLVPTAMVETKGRKLYIGQAGYVGEYSGYLDNASTYRMSYYTTWIDFGNPIVTSILKKIFATIIGLGGQSIVFKWAYDFSTNYYSDTVTLPSTGTVAEWGTFEWGIGEWGVGGGVTTASVNGSSAGKVLQFGFETVINNEPVSIQKIDLFTKDGKL